MRLLALTALLLGLSSAGNAQAVDTARYTLEVAVAWSAETHPLEFPGGAHFSDLIGATHDARYTLFADGRTASTGLELLAENGRASILRAELDEGARRGRIGAVFRGEGVYSLPGSITTTFDVDARHRLVSFATMIAPSPDWFTGLSGVDLMTGGQWIERLELALWAWDAGTDSGQTYTDPDADTQPRESVRLLASPHFIDDRGLKRVGTATLLRLR
jgi:Spondin_N